MRFTFLTSLSALLLSSLADAQQLGRLTTTLPWADGNTLVISVTTNALGQLVTSTISTVVTGVPGLTTATSSTSTGLLNPAIPVTTTSSTSTTRRTTATTATTPRTTLDPNRVVGDTTSNNGPPMRTTTYWYDPGGGVWTVATWTASITDHPAVATVIVPEGTIQDYNAYQSEINSNVLSSAQAAQTLLASGTSSGNKRIGDAPWGAMAGWTGMLVGMIGMGYGVLAL